MTVYNFAETLFYRLTWAVVKLNKVACDKYKSYDPAQINRTFANTDLVISKYLL